MLWSIIVTFVALSQSFADAQPQFGIYGREVCIIVKVLGVICEYCVCLICIGACLRIESDSQDVTF